MRNRLSLIRMVLLAGSAFASGAASAQEADGGSVDEAASSPAADGAEKAVSGYSDEIVVTATRREESLSRVPISVSAYSQEQLDRQGVKAIDDLARLTPGLNFSTGSPRLNVISIRGVSSPAGASTTGLYIDETPIQARLLGNSSSNAFPRVFDLERIEVLRGPQGTLFGAGAQGGVVRFITPGPNLREFEGYARAEVSTTVGGDESYEAGASLAGPIIDDVLAFRISAWHRRDAGWLDKKIGTLQVLSPTGTAGPDASLNFVPSGLGYADVNWSDATVLRAALTWEPTPDIRITPSIFYQREYAHDLPRAYWPALSDEEGSDFVSPQFVSSVDSTHIPLVGANPEFEPSKNRFYLPSLLINWDMGPISLVSNTAYFDRLQETTLDYTVSHNRTYTTRPVPAAGDRALSYFLTTQKNFSQEVRLQGELFGDRLNWVAGGFYSKNKQIGDQKNPNNFYLGMPRIGASGRFGVTGGAPFGPGYSAYENYFGIGLVDGYAYIRELNSTEEQLAAFGQVDWEVIDGLTVTAGLRAAKATFEYYNEYGGPANNLNQPQGRACVPNSNPCVPVPVGAYGPGEGPFAPAFVVGGGKTTEKPITPKFGVSWQIDRDHLVYGSVAKGYRTGGAQGLLPSACDAQLIQYGYVDDNGNARSPETYTSDVVWSYEVGAKNRLLGGMLQLASSLFYVKWKDIQTSVSINTCTQSFVDNVGDATSKGGDLLVQLHPMDGLSLGAAIAYTKTSFDEATIVGGRTLYSKGSAIPGSGAPWTVTLSGQYDFPVAANEGYVRGDYTYNSRYPRTGVTDPVATSYDLMIPPRGETHQVNARVGIRFDELDVSVFADNLLNAHPSIGLSRSNRTPIYTDETFRPRTIGVTAAYRF